MKLNKHYAAIIAAALSVSINVDAESEIINEAEVAEAYKYAALDMKGEF